MRDKPPYASFFSKINGKTSITEGPYETQWLNTIESYRWEYELKRRKTETIQKTKCHKMGTFQKGLKSIFDRKLYRQTF